MLPATPGTVHLGGYRADNMACWQGVSGNISWNSRDPSGWGNKIRMVSEVTTLGWKLQVPNALGRAPWTQLPAIEGVRATSRSMAVREMHSLWLLPGALMGHPRSWLSRVNVPIRRHFFSSALADRELNKLSIFIRLPRNRSKGHMCPQRR